MKRFVGDVMGKRVAITKLSAEPALEVHAELMGMISKAVPEFMEGAGKSESEGMEAFGNAIQIAFENEGSHKFVVFIKKALTSGHVIVEDERVNHLDDFERWDEIDGSMFMYEVFFEWLKLNFGSLLKKIGDLNG